MRRRKDLRLTTFFDRPVWMGLWGVGLVLCFLFDRQVNLEVAEKPFSTLQPIAAQLTDVALGVHWILGSFVLGLVLTVWTSRAASQRFRERWVNLRRWAFHLFLSLISTGLIVDLLKFIVGRARPSAWISSGHSFQYAPFNWRPDHQSFPSGHTQVIFCVATMLGTLWPAQRVVFFSLSLLIAFTRVLVLQHFASDVFAGLFIGIYGTHASMRFWGRWLEKPVPWS